MDRTNFKAPKPKTTISSLAERCTLGFERCINRSHGGEQDSINDAYGRFNVWAANIGAMQPELSLKSLDSRLRYAKLMRESVISGLERLIGVQNRST